MIVAGVVEVLWILLPHGGVGRLPDHPLFVAVETYVTVGLLGEVCLRLTLQGCEFFRQFSHLLDLAVAVISVLSSILFVTGMESAEQMAFAEMIVIARILFRLLRLLALTKGFQRQQQAADRKLEIVLEDTTAAVTEEP